jgi:hypothetical protein
LLGRDVEISDDVFLIQREVAEAYKAGKVASLPVDVGEPAVTGNALPSGGGGTTPSGIPPVTYGKTPTQASIPRLVWSGDVPHQKWMNFYTKVLSRFAATTGLKLTLRVEVAPAEGISSQKVDETKVALRELGLKDSLEGD